MGTERVDEVKGNVKEAVGKATGDERTEAEGRTEATVANLQRQAGDTVDKARDAASDAADKARDVASNTADKVRDVADDTVDKAKDALNR